MKLIIDTDSARVTRQEGQREDVTSLFSPRAFRWLSKEWLRVGWSQRYSYGFSWLGRPVIQLPEDLLRMQELLYRIQPDVVVETGIAHGGSLIFYASMCRLIGKGRVIGIDVEIRPNNRKAIENHSFAHAISLIEGSSVDSRVVQRVCNLLQPGETVLVVLDSCHTRDHVLAELEAYGPLVSPGSYIIATDGIMEDLVDAPRAQPDWSWNNPQQAVRDFVSRHPEFVLEEPEFLFNEGTTERVTYWPSAFLRKERHSNTA